MRPTYQVTLTADSDEINKIMRFCPEEKREKRPRGEGANEGGGRTKEAVEKLKEGEKGGRRRRKVGVENAEVTGRKGRRGSRKLHL